MASKNKNQFEHYLSPKDAQPILDEILRNCHLIPNSLPLDELENNALTTIKIFRQIKRICIFAIAMCLIMPLLLMKPSIFALPAYAANNQTLLEFDLASVLPIKSVNATLNGVKAPIYAVDGDTYRIQIAEAGHLTITATAYNNQKVISSTDVTLLHLKPEVFGSHRDGDSIVIELKEGSYPINFASIYATSSSGQKIYPLSIDEIAKTVTFAYPSEELNINISDTQGSSIVAILSVFYSKGESADVFTTEEP